MRKVLLILTAGILSGCATFVRKDNQHLVTKKVSILVDDWSKKEWQLLSLDITQILDRANQKLAEQNLPLRYDLNLRDLKIDGHWYRPDRPPYQLFQNDVESFYNAVSPEVKRTIFNGDSDVVIIFTKALPFLNGRAFPDKLMVLEEFHRKSFYEFSRSTSSVKDGRGIIFIGLSVRSSDLVDPHHFTTYLHQVILHEQGHLYGLEHRGGGIMHLMMLAFPATLNKFDDFSLVQLRTELYRQLNHSAAKH